MFRIPCNMALLVALFFLVACNQENTVSTVPDKSETTSANATSEKAERPNILFILADDLGFSDMGIYGGEIPTPNLDTLAKGGMMLTNFYSGQTCSPTRSMLMSGTDNHLAGVGVMGGPSREDHKDKPGYVGYLNFRVVSLADILRDAGYNTYITGKWHLGMDVENGPVARGFRRAFISLDGAAHLGKWDWRGPQPANYRDGETQMQVDDDFYSTRVYTEKMIEYIENDRKENKPFFAYLAYTAPHWPLQAPDESIARFKGKYDKGYQALYEERFNRLKKMGLIKPDAKPISNERFQPAWDALSDEEKKIERRKMEIYAAMVSDLDTYIGRFIDYLKSINEYDNTFIMFMSDNGAESSRMDLAPFIADHVGKEYDHSLENLGRGNTYVMYGKNWASVSAAPFFRHKATGFEGGVHVPAFVHYPKMVKAGTSSNGMGHVMDVYPTLLELAKAKHPGTSYRGQEVLPVKGKSLIPLITGQANEIHEKKNIHGWELHGHRGIRQGDWKLVWDQALPENERRWSLYNLAEDPFEQNDLSKTMSEKYKEMIANWDIYAQENGVIY
ncbi:MAG: arylsulfatase [Deltaproteobacteria bacterium]|nr:arylsulfatase [Deltaproteobacteria bacterium]